MSPRLLLQLAVGPLFALLTAITYRAALWVLDGALTDTHVWWGVVASVVAMLLGWNSVMVVSRPSDLELERDGLRAAAEEALSALEDWDTAWTPAGTDTRQALRHALGQPHWPVCIECQVDMGGHAHGCTKSREHIRAAGSKGGVA